MLGGLGALGSLHERPDLIERAASPRGRLFVWLLASALLVALDAHEVIPVALAAVMLLPGRRREILSLASIATAALLVTERLGTTVPALATLAAFVAAAVSIIVVWRQRRFMPGVIRSSPVLAVHAVACLVLAAAYAVPALGALAGGLVMLLWRASYLARYLTRAEGKERRIVDHLFYLLTPVYGGSPTPYGKGLTYLAAHEKHDPVELARSRLAGLKLLVLALAWKALAWSLATFVHGSGATFGSALELGGLDLPRVHELGAAGARGGRALAWLAIYLGLIESVLVLAAFGHVVVGSLRLLGFNVFRNTYKPLLAESIVEFWNRYYYYFKELLTDFFFYPVFLGARGVPARARLPLAVFAAACVGNMYYHVIALPELLLSGDVSLLWRHWSPRLLYCVLLATGIWLSMHRRQRGAVPAAGTIARIGRIAGVWTFFGLINVFNHNLASWGFAERMATMRYLFLL